VATAIEKEFPDIEVVGNETTPRPSAFEVTVGDKVLWSKLSGQGFPTPRKIVELLKAQVEGGK